MDDDTPARRRPPIRRDTLVPRHKLNRRRSTPAGVIGHAILDLISSIELQTAPDPRVTPAWHTLVVSAVPDARRDAIRLSATVYLDELPKPVAIPGGKA